MAGLLRSSVPTQKADLQGTQLPTAESTLTATEAQTGSAMASLWLKVNHNQQASPEISTASVQPCPQCGAALAPPLKSSGRQVCRCGWTDQPRPNQATQTNSGADRKAEADLLQLLEKAASESLENMKPRKKNP